MFIDEGAKYLNTSEFARMIRGSNNYYVIFNRESLVELPYSVNEIYEIKTSGRLHTLKKMYNCNKRFIYNESKLSVNNVKFLVTEDSKAGFQLYNDYFSDGDIECISAGSKSQIFNKLKELSGESVFVIADGAAFGAEMDNIMKLHQHGNNMFALCLPESFEWLILKSGLIVANDLDDVLSHTYDYVDGMVYFSWEQFFTKYLKDITKDTYYKYSKTKLNKFYKVPDNEKKIISQIVKN